MRLCESAAVLLIIGSAVVGPVASKCDKEWVRQCVDKRPAVGSAICGHPGYCKDETPAETCARAMKEIGVDADKSATAQHAPVERFLMSYGTLPGVGPVHCIPAPSGLKR